MYNFFSRLLKKINSANGLEMYKNMIKKDIENKQYSLEKKMKQIALKNDLTLGGNSLPIYDGIGNIEEYLLFKPRIACLLKEPYDRIIDGKAQGGDWSIVRDCFMKKNQNWSILTWQRIIYTVYGLRNNLKYMDMDYIRDEHSMGEVLRSIAWINLNKMPAQKKSDQTYIKNFKKYWKGIVEEQLEIYLPNVILCGNVFEACHEELFPKAKLLRTIPGKENMKDIAVYSVDQTLLFDLPHPGIIGKSHDAIGYYVNSINDVIKKSGIMD